VHHKATKAEVAKEASGETSGNWTSCERVQTLQAIARIMLADLCQFLILTSGIKGVLIIP